MSTPHCPVCQRWNDPTGGPDGHSGGCPNEGQPYPGYQPPEPRRRPQSFDVWGNNVEVMSWDVYEVQP